MEKTICTGIRKEMDKESTIITGSLLSISKVHIYIYLEVLCTIFVSLVEVLGARVNHKKRAPRMTVFKNRALHCSA